MKKLWLRLSIVTLIACWIGVVGVIGQSPNVLVPDIPTTGQIVQGESVKIFTFSASSGSVATLSISSETGFALTLALSDASGAVLGQVQKPAGAATGVPSVLENVSLPTTGTYYVAVLITPGVVTALTGEFLLLLNLQGGSADVAIATDVPLTPEPTPEAQLPPTTTTVATPETFVPRQVALPNGINVALTWNTQDDLNLQVRAPNGNTLFWDSRVTNDSGSFGPDVNGLCQILSTPPAIETATWSGGSLAAGSYEVLVYYRQSCVAPASPVDFTVDVSVNGVPLEPITGTLQPPVNEATVHIARFVINPDGSAESDNGGLYTDTRVLPISFSQIVVSPSTPVFFDSPTEGIITNDAYYDVYTFTGTAGQLVNISMDATVGNLDTLLILFDGAGNVIADNDDVDSPRNTNSLISTRLPSSGTYLVFASRYGKDVGGTEGVYRLLVSQQGGEGASALNLNFPTGDIEVTLIWDTNADLQLLVRDPFGESVYDDRPSVRSGGLLTATGNQNCVTARTSPPAYHIYWPSGTRNSGSYEIEVWYQSECGDTRPVTFSLFTVVGGELIATETRNIRFNERYVTSFTINFDGTVSPSLGGIIGGSETLPYQAEIANAIVMQSGSSFTGSITPDNKFDVYAFDGLVGDVVTIAMNANSPTLDPLLFLIDPSQIEIASNDDASADTRNSLISNLTLSRDGRYYILATHFGAIYGGTTGPYTLTLQIQRATPPETTP